MIRHLFNKNLLLLLGIIVSISLRQMHNNGSKRRGKRRYQHPHSQRQIKRPRQEERGKKKSPTYEVLEFHSDNEEDQQDGNGIGKQSTDSLVDDDVQIIHNITFYHKWERSFDSSVTAIAVTSTKPAIPDSILDFINDGYKVKKNNNKFRDSYKYYIKFAYTGPHNVEMR